MGPPPAALAQFAEKAERAKFEQSVEAFLRLICPEEEYTRGQW
jgi:hypothetical protein